MGVVVSFGLKRFDYGDVAKGRQRRSLPISLAVIHGFWQPSKWQDPAMLWIGEMCHKKAQELQTIFEVVCVLVPLTATVSPYLGYGHKPTGRPLL